MARRRALIEVEYETELNEPIRREQVERALNNNPTIACHYAEVLEDNLA